MNGGPKRGHSSFRMNVSSVIGAARHRSSFFWPEFRAGSWKQSLLQCLAEELKQRLCGRIVGFAEVLVDLGVGGLFGGENRGAQARVFQHVAQTQQVLDALLCSARQDGSGVTVGG